jgi:hypothetical protein
MHLLYILITVLNVAHVVDQHPKRAIWSLFEHVHNKQYVNAKEEQYRWEREVTGNHFMVKIDHLFSRTTFEDNVVKINRHNLEADSRGKHHTSYFTVLQ